MSKFPHMPLFTDAFIADTGHLSAQETGAYLMLLMVAWRTPECRLPDDDAKLARWARVTAKNWPRVKPVVMEFWDLQDGFWTQKRLTKERVSVSRKAEASRDNGSRGGRTKALKTNEPDNLPGSVGLSQILAPIPIPIATPSGVAASAPVKDPKTVAAFIDRMLKEFPEFGAQAASNFGLLSPVEINLWITQGADLLLDVEPVVRDILARPRRRPVGTWRFFERAVMEHHERRLSAKPTTALDHATPSTGLPYGQNHDGTRRPDPDGVVRVIMRSFTDRSFQAHTPDAPEMRNRWKFWVRQFLKGNAWDESDLGAPPGHPACLVPADILAEMMPPVPTSDGTGSTARH